MSTLETLRRYALRCGIAGAILAGTSGCDTADQVLDTIAAGATHMPFAPFLLVSALGRGARFFLVAGILRMFGAPVRRTLERNFDLAALIFLVLLFGGFLVIKLL